MGKARQPSGSDHKQQEPLYECIRRTQQTLIRIPLLKKEEPEGIRQTPGQIIGPLG